jgi:mannose-1-phosphate guanylyltransferase
LWNSGLFVWRARTLLDCVRRYAPECHEGLLRIAGAWKTPRRAAVLREVYPKLRKISIDFAVMEPASRDPLVRVAAVPMTIRWLDVGSWKSYGETCPHDAVDNAAGTDTSAFQRSKGCIVASSDPGHLVALLGCEDLVVIHTADATLVCPVSEADRLKDLHALVKERFGPKYL